MNDLNRKVLSTLFALLFVFASKSVRSQEVDLHSSVQELLDQVLASETPESVDDFPLYNACLQKHEELEILLRKLGELGQIKKPDPAEANNRRRNNAQEDKEEEKPKEKVEPQALKARWLLARLSWRYGLLEDAKFYFKNLTETDGRPIATFRLAQLTDALGNEKDAVEGYRKILSESSKATPELQEKARLRLAILKATGSKIEGLDDLTDYATGREQGFKNRSAVVLALAGRAKDALELYKAEGEGNPRFKQEVRLAEWAMAAKDIKKAKEFAWNALKQAKLRRDRRYALTVLSEAFRGEKKLDDLIKKFSEEKELDDQSRQTWIDLLRETGKIEEAIKLFKQQSSESGFDINMRRELLEICREAEKDELLIESYQDMIKADPKRVEWRAGLSRYYLEQGNREKGIEVWKSFEEKASLRQLLEAAGSLDELSLDELVIKYTERCVNSDDTPLKVEALYYLFGFHRRRANEEKAQETLIRMDKLAEPAASERVQLAEAWEQIGRHDQAARILEGLRQARGKANFSSDLEMRLAWLYSETGEEEKAYKCWKNVWLKVDSPGRRKYVEERLMATASRLGNLADIAIELEEKLAEGKADKRDSGLLVRLYTKVGDPISAAEITEEYMKQTGENEIKLLEEKARIYVLCNDYYHYEKTLRQLIELDPEGTPEYLTQMAMSCLERGRNDQARQILIEMRDLEANPAAAEFEAGVLKIAGLHEESAKAYWRGIGENPGRIDAYLLLGKSLQTINKGTQSIGLFQFLIENASKDDLFTIAIDGILNARAGSPIVKWAKRVLLERVASKEDKIYLFQLVSDLAEELRDTGMKQRALEEILPIAGEQRTSYLRELMELSKSGIRSSFFSSSMGSIRNKNNLLRYGRRLIGMGELIPPQIYLDLGQAFLESDDVKNAAKTFDKADQSSSDYVGYYRKVGQTFEGKLYARSALKVYERLLVSAAYDVSLIIKVAELKEQLAKDEEANQTFQNGLNLLLDTQTLWSGKKDNTAAQNSTYFYYYSRNVDNYQKYSERLLRGFLATVKDKDALNKFFDEQLLRLDNDLKAVLQEEPTATLKRHLNQLPRIQRRAQILRRLAFSHSSKELAKKVETRLGKSLSEDPQLFRTIATTWKQWGHTEAAKKLVEEFSSHPSAEAAKKLLNIDNRANEAQSLFLATIKNDKAESLKSFATLDARKLKAMTRSDRQIVLASALINGHEPTIEAIAKLEINSNPNMLIYQSTRTLGACLPFLNDERQKNLIDYVSGIIELKSDQLSANQWYYIENLTRITGRPIKIPAEKVKKQIFDTLARGAVYFYYMGMYFSLLPEEEYRTTLVESFGKAQKADRMRFLLEIVSSSPKDIKQEIKDTLIELTGELEGDVDTKRNHFYKLTSPYQYTTMNNPELVQEFLAKLGSTQSEKMQPYFKSMRALLLARQGNLDEALPLAAEVYKSILEGNKTIESYSRNYIDSVLTQRAPATFLKIIDEVAKEQGETVDLEKKRISLAQRSGNPDVLLKSLREAIKRHPKEITFYRQLSNQLKSLGRLLESVQVLEKLVEVDPQNPTTHNLVYSAWNSLKNPVRVQELRKELNDRANKKAMRMIEGTIWELLRPFVSTSFLNLLLSSSPQAAATPPKPAQAAQTSGTTSGAATQKAGSQKKGATNKTQAKPATKTTPPVKKKAATPAKTTTNKAKSQAATSKTSTKPATGTKPATAIQPAAPLTPATPITPATTASSGAAAAAPATAATGTNAKPAEEGKEPKKAEAEKKEEKEKKLQRPSISFLKKAYDDKKTDEAKNQLRRLWRQFESLDNRYFNYGFGYYYGSYRYRWPTTRTTTTKAPSIPVPPGGLEKFLYDQKRAEERAKIPRPKQEHIVEALAEEEFVKDEASRWLSTLNPNSYGGGDFDALLNAKAKNALKTEKVDEVFNDYFKRYTEGDLDKLGVLTLLRMIVIQKEYKSEKLDQCLDLMISRVSPTDQGFINTLAQCLSDRGKHDVAANLYLWGKALGRTRSASYSNVYYYPGRSNVNVDPIAEVTKRFKGELRKKTIQKLVQLSATYSTGNPADNISQDRLTLRAWSQILPIQDVFTQCEKLCLSAIETYTGQNQLIVQDVTKYLAAAGKAEEAAKGLEAIINWTPKSLYSRVYDPVYGGYYFTSSRSRSANQSQLTSAQLNTWFPETMAEWKSPDEWLRKASETILKSHAAKKLRGNDALQVLSLIAYRQTQLDFHDDASWTLAQLKSIDNWSRSESKLWVSDSLRKAQQNVEAAEIESELLMKGQLRLDRIKTLLREVHAHDSLEATLAIADQTVKYTLHDDLIDIASELSQQSEDIKVRETWADRYYQRVKASRSPNIFGYAYLNSRQAKLYQHQQLADERVILDTIDGKPVVVFYDLTNRLAHVYERGNHNFKWTEEGVVDGKGKAWDLVQGKLKNTDKSNLVRVKVRPWLNSRWQSLNPNGEIYLISALKRAEYLVRKGDGGWKFWDKKEAPPAKWNQIHFDDSSWIMGTAPLGYGESDIKSTVSFGGDAKKKNITVWFRRKVEIPEGKNFKRIFANVRTDDGSVLYVNGKEVGRFNMPAGNVTATTKAPKAVSEGKWERVFISPELFVKGTNIIALSVHQTNQTSSDMVLDLELGAVTEEALNGKVQETEIVANP